MFTLIDLFHNKLIPIKLQIKVYISDWNKKRLHLEKEIIDESVERIRL